MKDLTPQTKSALQAPEKAPLHLVEIELTNVTIRYAAATSPVTWDGHLWAAKGFEFSGIKQSEQAHGVGSARITFADAHGELRGFDQIEGLSGRKITLRRVFRDHLDDGAHGVVVLTGEIHSPRYNSKSFTIDISVNATLRRTVPRRAYTARCPWEPGGPECNHDGLLDNSEAPLLQSGTATLTAPNQITDAARDEADDFWRHGEIALSWQGGKTMRHITHSTDSGVLTLDSPIHAEIGESITYTLKRGCDGSFSACQGLLPWGATDDNSANFGGMLHVDRSAVRR